MTPEAIRIVSQLRHDFYTLFAAAMDAPVRITGKSYSNNSSIASWVDDRQRINYVNVYPYTAPDKFIPKRPLVLRVAINKSAGRVMLVKPGPECRGFNREWDFELTLLPEEIMDFLPWIVNWVKSHDKGAALFVQEPPHPLDLEVANTGLFKDVWTKKAWFMTDSSKSVQQEVVIAY